MTKFSSLIAIVLVAAACGNATESRGEPRLIKVDKAGKERKPQSGGSGSVSTVSDLPPLDLSGMKLWNFSAEWHASEWNNDLGAFPWKYDHVTQQADGDVSFVLDQAGAPQLQAVNGTPAHTDGTWEVDVTLPTMTSGVIVAPLWLYNQKTRDEVDFEFIGTKGLQVTVHGYPGGKHRQFPVQVFWGQDMSGQRMRLGIAVDQQRERISMIVDGEVVHRFTKQEMGFFPTSAMRPLMEMWAVDPTDGNLVNWAGPWNGTGGNALRMTVHGYRYSQ